MYTTMLKANGSMILRKQATRAVFLLKFMDDASCLAGSPIDDVAKIIAHERYIVIV